MLDQLISIIVPAYNVECYLNECLNSIKRQSYKNIEVIIIDDGSTDGTSEIARKFINEDSRFNLIEQNNAGLSAARNNGLQNASGEWVAFIDSDDFVSEKYLETMIEKGKKQNVNIVASSFDKFVGQVNVEKHWSNESYLISNKEFFSRLGTLSLPEGIDVSAHSKLFKRKLFNSVEFPVGKLFEDSFVLFDLVIQSDNISIIDNGAYKYRMRSNSIVQSKFNLKRLDFIDAEKQMCLKIVNEFPELKFQMAQRITHAYLATLGHIVESDNKKFWGIAKNIRKEILNNNFLKILFVGSLPLKDRVGMLSLTGGINAYKYSYLVFRRVKYGNRFKKDTGD